MEEGNKGGTHFRSANLGEGARGGALPGEYARSYPVQGIMDHLLQLW